MAQSGEVAGRDRGMDFTCNAAKQVCVDDHAGMFGDGLLDEARQRGFELGSSILRREQMVTGRT